MIKHILLMAKVLFWTSFFFASVFLVQFFIHKDMQSLKEFVVTFIVWVVILASIVFIQRTTKCN